MKIEIEDCPHGIFFDGYRCPSEGDCVYYNYSWMFWNKEMGYKPMPCAIKNETDEEYLKSFRGKWIKNKNFVNECFVLEIDYEDMCVHIIDCTINITELKRRWEIIK